MHLVEYIIVVLFWLIFVYIYNITVAYIYQL